MSQLRTKSKTCRAALFRGTGRPLELCDVPLPDVQAGEALVRVDCCTICGSDLHTITGARREPTPSILGHEIVGTVTDYGDPPLSDLEGSPLRVGDRVTWSTALSCGACDRCSRGMPQKCRTVVKYGHERAEGRTALSGGLAEYVLLRPGTVVVKLSDEIPDAGVCPVNCATATVVAACRTSGPLSQQRVLILGAGMLGLTATALARSQEASEIVVCDPSQERREKALLFGADRTIDWDDEFAVLSRRLADGSGSALFDVVLEFSGAPQAVHAACRLGDVAARVVLVGSVMPKGPVSIDPEQIVRGWTSLHGVHNYAPQDLQTAVQFLERRHSEFPFAELVERTFSLNEVNAAVETALRDRPVRVAVVPSRS